MTRSKYIICIIKCYYLNIIVEINQFNVTIICFRYAIYIPLFLPVMIPVIMSLIHLLKKPKDSK